LGGGGEESPYYPVGADCVLYHAYWDGTALDQSESENDGNVVGGTFGIKDGASALLVDGINDLVQITQITHIAPFTITAWIWEDSTVGGNFQVVAGGHSVYYFGYQAAVDHCYNNPYGITGTFTRADSALYNKWSNWTFTYDNSLPHGSCIARGYLNGVEAVDSPKTNCGSNSYYDIDTICGYHQADTSLTLKGAIGEVLIFNLVKSQAEITAYINATKARYGL